MSATTPPATFNRPVPFPPMDWPCLVVSQQRCGEGLFRLLLEPKPSSSVRFQCQAGQFVMLDLPEDSFSSGFGFRRPFSVMRVEPETGRFELFYKVVGRGTLRMSQLRPGEILAVLGPLGHGFPTNVAPEGLLLVGGGIGVAPMIDVADRYRQKASSVSPWCFYGARNRDNLGIHDVLCQLIDWNRLHICTDDGSFGFQGHLGELLAQYRPQLTDTLATTLTDVFVCGPNRMMAAVTRFFHDTCPQVTVWVSLENPMPCGTGSCFGCVVPLAGGGLPSRSCVDGPVYRATDLRWEADGPATDWETTACPPQTATEAAKATETTACSVSPVMDKRR
ncbi:MAG: hypothetical protein SFZ03_02165 [Candidatus Melainabacteria bacterium]|nr:hypothetical protein [Candidatus Melainabacteria bacterium]